ncbi:Uncharacterised protein [Mycobacteroides abscessus subsp. abscessus]|nr:Uncharacterised protein [Mycobacteroides abscessus subsp. abscessus]
MSRIAAITTAAPTPPKITVRLRFDDPDVVDAAMDENGSACWPGCCG